MEAKNLEKIQLRFGNIILMVEIKTEDFKYHPQIYVSVLSLEDSLLAENVRSGNNLKGPSRESPSTFWNFWLLILAIVAIAAGLVLLRFCCYFITFNKSKKPNQNSESNARDDEDAETGSLTGNNVVRSNDLARNLNCTIDTNGKVKDVRPHKTTSC